jgi:hypothetical protein
MAGKTKAPEGAKTCVIVGTVVTVDGDLEHGTHYTASAKIVDELIELGGARELTEGDLEDGPKSVAAASSEDADASEQAPA